MISLVVPLELIGAVSVLKKFIVAIKNKVNFSQILDLGWKMKKAWASCLRNKLFIGTGFGYTYAKIGLFLRPTFGWIQQRRAAKK